LAIILSWLYDLTSEGVERTKPLNEIQEGEKPVVPNTWKIATYVSFVVIIGLVVLNVMGKSNKIRPGSIQSLVVLPFDNFTGDEQLEYFVSGMHSSLIGDMGKISGLRVISKTSSNTYKGMDMSAPEIASELMVDAVVESTVMCLGDSICLQVKVISAFPEEKQLWIGDYKEEKSQILNLYNRVTKQVADEVKIELTSDEESLLAESKTVNPDAYEMYLKGKFKLGFLSKEDLLAARDYFQKAIEIDNEFAPAYAGMAGVWIVLKQMNFVSPDEANPKLEEYLSKAIQLDSQNVDVYYFDALKKMNTDFDWEAAERSFKRCLELNPNFSEAWAYYSNLLMYLMRPDEMRETMKRALEIDPNNYLIQTLAGVNLMVESKYELCINSMSQLQKIIPNDPIISNVLFVCYAETGKHDLAIIELKKRLNSEADETIIKTLDEEFNKAGFKKAVSAVADVWEEQSPPANKMVMLYAYAGNVDKMLDWIEKMYIRKHPGLQYIGAIPYYRSYQEEPRYIEIMHRMNLPLGEFQ
jgi:TolB-like protein/Tfp pilus assembly protein PilF